MAGDHTGTSKNNLDILIKDLGLIQYRNTTIFTKGKKFILSPSIGNDSNWFDIRKVNLDKFTSEYTEGYLIVRFKEKLLIQNLRDFINTMIDINKFSDTTNSGIHWKFVVGEPLGEDTHYKIVSRLSKCEMETKLVDKFSLKSII